MEARQDPMAFAHAHRDEVVWMSQNTNELVQLPAVDAALKDAVASREYARYPPAPGLPELRDLVLRDMDVAPDAGYRSVITAGALEACYVLNRALVAPGGEVVSSDPSFLPLHQQIALGGGTVVEVPVYGAPWKLTPDAVAEAITPKTKALLLIDPLNPVGSQYDAGDVRAFADLANDHDLVLVHDVTYRDFARDPANAHEWAPERTIYAYSFSKNCGLAGMRLGALAGPEALMKRVDPFFVGKLGTNVLAQRAAIAALSTKREWLPKVLDTARSNERRIVDTVTAEDGFHVPVTPSSTNTLLVDVTEAGVHPVDVERRLLFEHKVFVRAGSYLSPRFGDRFVRVSFTAPPAGVERFCEAWPRVIADLKRSSA